MRIPIAAIGALLLAATGVDARPLADCSLFAGPFGVETEAQRVCERRNGYHQRVVYDGIMRQTFRSCTVDTEALTVTCALPGSSVMCEEAGEFCFVGLEHQGR